MELTHFNKEGRAKMVDVSEKNVTSRTAIAQAKITMKEETLKRIISGEHKKGDVLGVSQIAGIMGVKKTSEIIPMCHPLILSGINLSFEYGEDYVMVFAKVTCTGQTGVEMEALTGASVAALTIYDMCKAIDKDMVISDVCLLEKTGGKSGLYRRTK
ncbi:cyclic pyranopterin monophosphate synthase MoaC [Mycoplasmatota bacterium WC44]